MSPHAGLVEGGSVSTPDQENVTENEPKPVRTTAARKKPATETGDLAAELRVAIMKTSRRLRLESSSEMLTPAQYSVLAALKTEGHTIGELAQREQVAAPSMTRIVKSLVESGWVTRTSSAQDARQVMIDISEEGMRTFVGARSQRTAWLARRIDQLGEDDRQILARAAALLQEMSAK